MNFRLGADFSDGFDPKIVPSIPDEEIWEDEDEEESGEEIDE